MLNGKPQPIPAFRFNFATRHPRDYPAFVSETTVPSVPRSIIDFLKDDGSKTLIVWIFDNEVRVKATCRFIDGQVEVRPHWATLEERIVRG